jgi:hypothetical protein
MGAQSALIELQPPSCSAVETMEKGCPRKKYLIVMRELMYGSNN